MVTLIAHHTRDPFTCMTRGCGEKVWSIQANMLPLIWIAAAVILALTILSVPYVQRLLFGKNREESKLTVRTDLCFLFSDNFCTYRMNLATEVNEAVLEDREPRVVGGTRRVRGMRHRAEVRARRRDEENGKESSYFV